MAASSNELDRRQNIAALLPTEGDSIAFCFACRLKVDQQDRITCAAKKARPLNHTQSVRSNPGQEQDRSVIVLERTPPRGDVGARIALEVDR